jgi:hypothetical protein
MSAILAAPGAHVPRPTPAALRRRTARVLLTVASLAATWAGTAAAQAKATPAAFHGIGSPGDSARGDTVRRPVAVDYSDWYSRRLTIHRLVSWTMLPLFGVEYAAGQQLLQKGRFGAPAWARQWHSPVAGAIGGLFALNTVTGVWNLYDSRRDPAGRPWRTAHAVLMLAADAGFVATGMLAGQSEGGAEFAGNRVTTHRAVAIGSMSLATLSWVMMLKPFRRD